MNSVYFQGQEVACLHQNICSVGKLLDMLNGKIIRSESWHKELKMDSLTKRQYSAISEHSSVKDVQSFTEGLRTLLVADSHANLTQLPENNSQEKIHEICGLPLAELSTSLDHPEPFWKTCQVLLVMDISETFLKTFPKSGTMRNGKLYQRKKQVPVTREIGGGLWRTPGAYDAEGLGEYKSEEKLLKRIAGGKQLSLNNQVKFEKTWATPNTLDHMGLRSEEALKRQFKTTRKGRTSPANLREQVHPECYQDRLWPTPTKCGNHNRKGVSKTSGDGLATAVKYPTPTASDFKRRGPNSKQQGLPEIVKNFPTPAARDWKGGRSPDGLKAAGRNETNSLNDTINAIEGKTAQLNPDWVEWLMSWPIGWSDLKPLKELIWLNPSVDPHPEIPRVTTNKKNRTNRLKAIGNGQVPDCAATAWNILTNN